MKTKHFEETAEFNGFWKIKGYDGIAFRVFGYETDPVSVWQCADCSACGFEREHGGGKTTDPGDKDCDHNDTFWNDEPEFERTGNLIACMVGDDKLHSVDPSDLIPLPREAFCLECGQIGCHCDGYGEDE